MATSFADNDNLLLLLMFLFPTLMLKKQSLDYPCSYFRHQLQSIPHLCMTSFHHRWILFYMYSCIHLPCCNMLLNWHRNDQLCCTHLCLNTTEKNGQMHLLHKKHVFQYRISQKGQNRVLFHAKDVCVRDEHPTAAGKLPTFNCKRTWRQSRKERS